MRAVLALLLGLLALALWALGTGSAGIGPHEILIALIHGGDSREVLLITTVRLPRMLAALAVGAALGGSGAILQMLTRNPLADPGLLGINAGAALAVVLLVTLVPGAGRSAMVPVAFLGAGLAALAVHALGAAGRSGATPLRLTLAGVVIASFLAALTAVLLIFDAATLDAVRQWTVGSLSGQGMVDLAAPLPWLAFAVAAALILQSRLAVIGLGPEVAAGLGANVALWWGIGIALAALLAASAVALAGPVGFVGLIVPQAVRLVAGARFARLLPLSMLAGAAAVLLADTLPRATLGRDIPVGVALALIGGPVFLWLARSRIGRLA
ncbi:FecCD family ABC transporter permease [Pseudogemmobacter sonorensis]|uniref:FecCD family ABC transporter permease n=1 Tax=Pseudogemmobacter sonorensis TaxID=2989681 RepID=UPI0036BC2B36